jgi:hypothetical protein
MAHARVVFELDGLMYSVGPVRFGLAMRAATSREFSLLRPFPTVAGAERMCRALSRAQVIRFADEETAQVDGQRTRKRRAGRRRRELRMPVQPASMPAVRPSAPPRPSVEASPSRPSRPILRGPSLQHRPTPEVVAAVDNALDRLETRS